VKCVTVIVLILQRTRLSPVRYRECQPLGRIIVDSQDRFQAKLLRSRRTRSVLWHAVAVSPALLGLWRWHHTTIQLTVI
jgi:hypothetical protein